MKLIPNISDVMEITVEFLYSIDTNVIINSPFVAMATTIMPRIVTVIHMSLTVHL